ncbi:MAG: type III-B CRISPR module RAMP protein Cmr6 [Deltaproteobacteria bacterium]
MPIAAVPNYLGKDFENASPGMRFGMLLPIWTTQQDQEKQVQKLAHANSPEGRNVAAMLQRLGMDETIRQLQRRERNPLPGLWDKNDFAAKEAWNKLKKLCKDDQKCMKALADRQRALAQTVPADSILRLDAIAVAPFTTGLGNEHPLKNGFAFLNPYGLPYLPGSGVKGVLRQAARELASGNWGKKHDWSDEKDFTLQAGQERIAFSTIDALFGLKSKDGDTDHVRGALTFWDVIPQIKGDSLMVEIMTPHQSHYYQQKPAPKTGDSTSPHDSGQPTPISFLTVPPESGFTFFVTCDLVHLNRLAPELAQNEKWKELLKAAFEHAFQWLGFGAKTAVGYGAMLRDQAAELEQARRSEERERMARQAAEAERLAKEREAELAKLDPVERSIREFLDGRPDKNQPEISAVIGAVKQGRWQDAEKIAVASWLKKKMQENKEWKESSRAKKPEKDREYQKTLLVKSWLEGKA